MIKQIVPGVVIFLILFNLCANNILPNGSFSKGTESWRTDENAVIDRKVYCKSRDDNHNSLRITSNECWRVVPSEAMVIVGGIDYRIQGRMRLKNAKASHVKVVFYNMHDEIIKTEYPLVGTNGSRDWFDFLQTITAPDKAVSAKVLIYAGGTQANIGITWVDELTFIPVNAKVYHEKSAKSKPLDIFPDGGYLNWIIETAASDNKNISAVDVGKDHKCLKVESSRTWEVITTPRIRIAGDKRYKFSVRTKFKNAVETHIKILWLQGQKRTDYLIRGTNGNREWYTVSKILTAPANSEYMVMQFYVGGNAERVGISWFDKISIVSLDPKAHSEAVELTVKHLKMLPAGFFNNSILSPKGKAVSLGKLSLYRILIGDKADKQEKYSAKLLQDCLKAATGEILPIVTKSEKEREHYISVGNTDLALKNSITAPPEPQSYKIAFKGNNLFIIGSRGPVYGVIALLEEDFGMRWFNQFESPVMPRCSPDSLSVVPREYAPPFQIREVLIDDAMGNDAWDSFNRMQNVSYFCPIPYSKGGGLCSIKYFVHTYCSLVPSNIYYQKHPEYFPLLNGKRFKSTPHDGQLCYTNRDLSRLIAKKIQAEIKKHPATKIYCVGRNDTVNSNCECKQCSAVIKTDGIAGASLLLANRVADIIAAKYPDVMLRVQAYADSQKPPVNIRPHKNILIEYAPICQRAGGMQLLPWKDIPQIRNEMSQWRKISNSITIWDYINRPYMPLPNFDVFDMNLKMWLKNGVTGVFLESAEFRLNSLNPLKAWVFTKKLWNPAWDINGLIEEFIRGYYGQAATEMSEYVKFQRKKWHEFYVSYRKGNDIRYTDEDKKIMRKLLDKAYSKVANNRIVQRKIACEIASILVFSLKICTPQNIVQYEQDLNLLKTLIKKFNIDLGNEKYGQPANARILKEFDSLLCDIKTGKIIPRYCQDSIILKKKKGWYQVKTYPDKEAYSGRHARQILKSDWCVQWDFAPLLMAAPNQQVYVVRMRLKPELKESHPDLRKACGLFLHMFGKKEVQGNYVKFKDLKNGKYQYVYFFKLYMYTPATSGYFYNCIGTINKNEAILYDLIEFIPIEKFKDKALADKLPEITL